MANRLLSCPFCGNADFSPYNGKSIQLMENERRKIYGIECEPYKEFYVRCHKCGAQSGKALTGYIALIDKTVSEDQARQIAINNWNMRPAKEGRKSE